jgi:hypothetical protein
MAVDFSALRTAFQTLLRTNEAALSKGLGGRVRVMFGDPDMMPITIESLPLIILKIPHAMASPAGALGNVRKQSVRVLASGLARATQPNLRQEFVTQTVFDQAAEFWENFETIIRNNVQLDGSLAPGFIECLQDGDAEFRALFIGQTEERTPPPNAYGWQATFLCEEMA